jgi:hypothetical protein
VSVINTIYIALLGVYVGSKEVQRWSQEEPPAGADVVSFRSASFRVPGEIFVTLWVVFTVTATLAAGYAAARFVYPPDLTMITYKVLGFYLGSGASKWLKERIDRRGEGENREELEARAADPSKPPTVLSPRAKRKREMAATNVLTHAVEKGFVTRSDVQKITGLSKGAATRLLNDLVEAERLVRVGEPGDTTVRYTVPTDSG